jgi:hypothetical protein
MTTGERKPRWWSRDSFFLILTGHRTIQCGCRFGQPRFARQPAPQQIGDAFGAFVARPSG